MPRSVSIIDYKIAQADFFLTKLDAVGHDFFAAQCYCDAFVSACRSVTFAVQSVCKDLNGFDSWYRVEQDKMRNDSLLRFFHDYRTISNHIGQTPVLGGFSDPQRRGSIRLTFLPTGDLPKPPEIDVHGACVEYFTKTLDLVFRLYERFPADLDDRWHYTQEHFSRLGFCIEDAEEALGFPRGWTSISGTEEELLERWRLLRRTETIGPQIQEAFHRYLGRVFLGPDDNVEQGTSQI